MMSESAVQTSPHLSSSTPRKKKLKNEIKKHKKKIKNMERSMKIRTNKRIRNENALESALEKLPRNLQSFVRMQIKLCSQKKQGRRYSAEMKSFALSLFHTSGKAYRLLSKLFVLPSKTSLHRYISIMPAEPGISEVALRIIHKRVQHMKANDKLCTLCMDEISLKTHLR